MEGMVEENVVLVMSFRGGQLLMARLGGLLK